MDNTPNTPFSAIIVLAHLMDEHAHLNSESRARMDKAVEAYRNKEASIILTTGWAYRPDVATPIADVMRDYAIDHHNIDPEAVLADPNARDTVGDAVFTKRHFSGPRHWNKLLVVTSSYHVARTQAIFNFIYGGEFTIEVRGAPVAGDHALSEAKSLEAFRNTFDGITSGDDAAIFKTLLKKHPFYNGMTHPKYTIDVS